MVARLVYAGRQPAPKDLLGTALYGLGSLFRGVGVALDELGATVLGSTATRDQRECLRGDVAPPTT